MIEQFEFDECELYGEPGFAEAEQGVDTDEQADVSEGNEPGFSEDEAEDRREDGSDNRVDRPGSAASSSTHLEIPLDSNVRSCKSLVPDSLPASRLPPSGQVRRSTSLLESNVKLGASAPINIPFMGNWRNDFADADARPPLPQTFVPPHQLSQTEDFTFSFTGASPSANLKREKLRVRNMILQRTGFLEVEKSDSENDQHQVPTMHSGGLSAAFAARHFDGP